MRSDVCRKMPAGIVALILLLSHLAACGPVVVDTTDQATPTPVETGSVSTSGDGGDGETGDGETEGGEDGNGDTGDGVDGGGNGNGRPQGDAVLTARAVNVTHRPKGGDEESVPLQARRNVVQGDKVGVDGQGEALLRFRDFLVVRLFRDSGLQVEAVPAEDAPLLYRFRLQAGTIFGTVTPEQLAGERVSVTATTDTAVIKAAGTEFLMYQDPESQFTWAVVPDGEVRVEAQGMPVVVPAGWQTWVEPGQAPHEPVPATREAVGDMFPLIEDLTRGALTDEQMLTGREPTSTPAAPPVALTSFTLDPATVSGGDATLGAVTLTGPAPAGGAEIVLSSSPPEVVRLPETVVVEEGATSATFEIATSNVSEATEVELSASYESVVQPASLLVEAVDVTGPPAPSPQSPAGDATLACGESVVLSWTPVEDPSGILQYEWVLEQSPTGDPESYTPIDSGTTTDTSASPSQGISCGLWYRWAVRAVDGQGQIGAFSPYANFGIGTDID